MFQNHAETPCPDAGAALTMVDQSPAQKALVKLGLTRPIDLALHLPLRYEDETRITRLMDARDGEVVQFERLGYFAADPRTPALFHRTVGLRDEWAAAQRRG